MIRDKILQFIKSALLELDSSEELKIDRGLIKFNISKEHGDYSTNIAMCLKTESFKTPKEKADILKEKLEKHKSIQNIFKDIKVAEPGFINFFVSEKYLQSKIKEILKQEDKFGNLRIGKKQKVNVEFISANPTGPLTLGNGRGGFCGDVLSNVLEKAGFKVEREYYINDVGEQIRKLGHSVIGDTEPVYKGKYIEKLRKKIKEKNIDKAGEKAGKIILKEMIEPSVKKMGIKFDTWFSEKSLYKNKEIDKILNLLKKQKLTYEKENALWFKSTKFGDDKDRVLIKADEEKTYLASDLAYLKNKFERGFKKLIFFWGADHYGYIDRLKAGAEALGYKKEQIDIIIMQLVHLFEEGKETKMSKRAGDYIVLDELIGEVGLDVSRFFFLSRSAGSHLNFDLDLAKEQSEKNPVYYVQYAYARISSILKKAKSINFQASSFKLLNHPKELNLIKQLARFPEIIEDTSKDYQVQRIPQYSIDLADAFHQFYEKCRVISEDKKLTQARLSLVLSAKIVLKNTLDLMGIKTPEKM